MAYLPPAQRALDVVSPVVIYRQIGRRPSAVYVDEAMTMAKSGKAAGHQLSDRIYWRTVANPGDQIQERPGGVLLVTASGQCFPILLSEPTPLTADTAFVHADLTIKADRSEAERLIGLGSLTEASPRRPKGGPSRPSEKQFAPDHPLVVDKLPHGIALDAEIGPNGRFTRSWTRGQRPRPR
jgi:hypothetical protein